MNFRILEHIDKLTPTRQKGRYICPVCGGNNLTIDREGAYSCWNECQRRDIREAIAPWQEKEKITSSSHKPSKPKKQLEPAQLPEKINLAKLPQKTTDSPQPQKRFDNKHGEVLEWTYYYTADKWKIRTQWVDATKSKGYDKSFLLWHRDVKGKSIAKAGEGTRPPYRIDEAIAAAKASGVNAVMGAEGEESVERYRQIGIACITLSGFSQDELALMTQLLKDAGLGLVYHPDHDQTGRNKADNVQQACDRAGVFCIVLDPVSICPNLPKSGDVIEILAVMEVREFIQKLEAEIYKAVEARRGENQLQDVAASTDLDERLKLELQALQQESDPFKKARRRAEIASHYRISKQEIQELLKHLEQKTATPQKNYYTFDEFFNEGSEAIQWLVPQLLPRGETVLLAAQAKCGKTALATDIMYAVLSGSTVISEQVGLKGKVLLISSDESPNSTRRRMRLRGFDLLDECSNLRLLTHLDITNLAELEAKLEDFRPDLVVIDSLSTVCSEVGISEKDPEYARYIYNLKVVLGRYNAACILIHHENKDPLAKGINQVSGSARILAAVWGVLQLKAIDPNNETNPHRLLKLKPREGEAIALKLQLNPKDTWLREGIWTCTGELGDESGEKKTQGDRVLDLLRKYSPKGLTYQEIDNALTIGRSLYQVLDRLEDRQLVTKRRSEFNSRQWVYAVPKSGGDTPPPSVDRAEGVEKPESVAKSELLQFNNSFNTNSTPVQQPIVPDAVLNSHNQDAASHLASIQQLDNPRGGEGVLNSTDQVLNSAEGAITTPASLNDSFTQRGNDNTAATETRLKIGDLCRYSGPEGAMAVTCRGKILDVLEVRSRDGFTECRIKFKAWAVSHWVSVHHLRRVTNG